MRDMITSSDHMMTIFVFYLPTVANDKTPFIAWKD